LSCGPSGGPWGPTSTTTNDLHQELSLRHWWRDRRVGAVDSHRVRPSDLRSIPDRPHSRYWRCIGCAPHQRLRRHRCIPRVCRRFRVGMVETSRQVKRGLGMSPRRSRRASTHRSPQSRAERATKKKFGGTPLGDRGEA